MKLDYKETEFSIRKLLKRSVAMLDKRKKYSDILATHQFNTIFNPRGSNDPDAPDGPEDPFQGDGESELLEEVKVKKPRRYKVMLHNDDYTTMEFVIYILQNVFGKTFEEAKTIMLSVHNKGIGVCGIYSYEIAESKSTKVEKLAKENGHPLMCTIEPE